MNAMELAFVEAVKSGDRLAPHAYHDWLIKQNRGADARSVAATIGRGKIEGTAGLEGLFVVAVERATDELTFVLADGTRCRYYHSQDCCESVYIEDVCGDLDDLVCRPLLLAEEVSNYEGPEREENWGSYTWTFYKFASARGAVTVRWLGESNGYYSERVDFSVAKNGKEEREEW